MNEKAWLADLFDSIDAKDVEAFIAKLDDNCTFIFGNLPAVNGHHEISQFVSGFFDSIQSIKHDVADFMSIPGEMVCHGMVTYTRHDNSTLSVPFSNLLKLTKGKVTFYQVFVDSSPLYTTDRSEQTA